MHDERRQAVMAMRLLAQETEGLEPVTAAVDGYRVTGPEPGEPDYADGEWNGSDAESSYPNPSADDTDLSFLADHYLFAPEDLSEDDPPPKSAFKAPIRLGPGGPVSTRALEAVIAALNGARGGFDDIAEDTLRDGFDAAVEHLVAADVYDSAEDAPGMDIAAQRLAAQADYSTGDLVRWMDGDADVYGIVRDRATSGENVFSDRIDGDFSLSPTEDNPGYLVETMDQTDDGWVPSGTMTGHRGETLEPWDPDAPVMDDGEASVTTLEAQRQVRFDATVTADTATGSPTLTGIVWGAGDHDLALGGEPTPVRVPTETIQPTYDALQQDVAAGDVTLGFDHPGPDSVAAKTGIVDIGVAQDVALDDDGRNIVLTDSELTNDQAMEAAAAGDFDDLDWSVVADVAVRRDDDGDVVQEDGRVVLDATRIRRIDAVDTGAVDAASIERGTEALPSLQDRSGQVRQAASAPGTRTDDAVSALRATASDIESMQDTITTDVDDLETAREQLSAAADVIDTQQDELEAAQAKADGFARLLQAHGEDPEEYDDPQAAAQAVIDAQTEDIRQDIAELEAELGAYDTDDVEARTADLAGNDPADLEQMLNARKATAFDAQQKRQQRGRAAAKGDTTGRTDPSGGPNGTDADADDIALQAMDGRDRIEAEANGQSPAEYVQDQYGVHASQYDAADELHEAIMDTMNGGDA